MGFQFSQLPAVLEPYFGYVHMSKYMQIFSFLLKVKHCSRIISQSFTDLSKFNSWLEGQERERRQEERQERLHGERDREIGEEGVSEIGEGDR